MESNVIRPSCAKVSPQLTLADCKSARLCKRDTLQLMLQTNERDRCKKRQWWRGEMQGSKPIATGKTLERKQQWGEGPRTFSTWRDEDAWRSCNRVANSFEVGGNLKMFWKAIKNIVMHDTRLIYLLLKSLCLMNIKFNFNNNIFIISFVFVDSIRFK